jgi:hypothetical protein
MLRYRSRPVFWGCLFFILSFPSYSQDLEVGISGGGAYYLGDLNPGKQFLNTQLSYGALIRYNIDTRWAVKLAVTRGSVKGNASQGTPFIQSLGLAFKSNITDISGVAEFNFFPYFTGSERNRISPYLYAGISVFFFNPYVSDPAFGKQYLKELGTEGQNTPYSPVGISIPFGLGVKVSLTERLGLQVYWEMHKTFTDYLDDVSTTFYLDGARINRNDPKQYLSDPLMSHQAGMQRGDPGTMDWFSFFGVSLCYKFNLPGSKKCKDLNH